MTTPAQLEERYLPVSLRRIAEKIGLAPTLQLVSRHGGTQIFVPMVCNLVAEHPLVQLLGQKEAAGLAQLYGGEYLDVPRALRAVLAVRDTNVRAERAAGRTEREVALKYHLTERRVRMIAGDVPDDRQTGLF